MLSDHALSANNQAFARGSCYVSFISSWDVNLFLLSKNILLGNGPYKGP